MKLIFINELGPSYIGSNVYEFIFSNSELNAITGMDWDSNPCSEKPGTPDIKFIDKVGTIAKNGLKFDIIQKSDTFSMYDSISGVIALGWESEVVKDDRLVFQFGEEIKSVEEKFYSRDLKLNYEKKWQLETK